MGKAFKTDVPARMKQLPMMRRGVLNNRVVPNARKHIPTCKFSGEICFLFDWEERFQRYKGLLYPTTRNFMSRGQNRFKSLCWNEKGSLIV